MCEAIRSEKQFGTITEPSRRESMGVDLLDRRLTCGQDGVRIVSGYSEVKKHVIQPC